jgi:hypothetical protein
MPKWLWPPTSAEAGVLVRLGRVIHWISYAITFPLLALCLIASFTAIDNWDEFLKFCAKVFVVGVAGRCARYILSNE